MTVKPGSINMARILRHMAQRSNQSRKVTFYRAPLYTTDDYGVEGGAIASNEIQLPGLPALIRPALTADYQRQRSGQNIIGAGRIYTANLSTIKGMPNFNQDNNTDFNEIEGWDKFIDTSRDIYQVPTSGTGSWSTTAGTLTSDGVTITNTMAGNEIMEFSGADVNTLEADRVTFKLKGSGSVSYDYLYLYNSGTAATSEISYDNSDVILLDDKWLTIDLPWTTDIVMSGNTNASGTSIYQTGSRYNVAVTAGDTYDYTKNLRQVNLRFLGDSGDTLQIKDFKLYKSLEWSVHSVKELNDDFNVFNVVRTAGRIDSRRRADAS